MTRELSSRPREAIAALRYFPRWSDSLEPDREPLRDRQAWITYPALDFLGAHLSSGHTIFEYGGGGSTLFFLDRAREVVTVEHDRDWFSRLQAAVGPAASRWSGHLVAPECAGAKLDLDPANPAHYYSDDDRFSDCTFRAYCSLIDRFRDGHFDAILIDGRARPSCISHALVKLRPGGYLILDNAERPYYLRQTGDALRSQFRLVLDRFAPVPYTRHFSQTNIWQRREPV